MLEQFTAQAINVLMLAQEEARALGHNFVAPEFLLLGLIQDRNGSAGKTFRNCGVSLQRARIEVEKIVGRGPSAPNIEMPFTPRAKFLLERAFNQVTDNQIGAVDTASLLLALLGDNEGVAARVLASLGVTAEQITATLADTVQDTAAPSYLLQIGLHRQIGDLEYVGDVLNDLDENLKTIEKVFQRIRIRIESENSRSELTMLEKRLAQTDSALAESPRLRESIEKLREHLWRVLMADA